MKNAVTFHGDDMKNIHKSAIVILLAAFLLAGCRLKDVSSDSGSDGGTGGGGGGGEATVPTAGAAAAVIQNVIAGMNIGFIGLTLNKPSFGLPEYAAPGGLAGSGSGISGGLGKMDARLLAPFGDLSASLCAGGGTAVSTTGVDPVSSNFKITLVFDNCLNPSQATTLNLTLDMVFPEIPSLPVSVDLCDGLRVDMEVNGKRAVSGQAFDSLITYTAYQMSLTANGCDSNGVPDDFILQISGDLDYQDNRVPGKSYTVNDTELIIDSLPQIDGTRLSYDGTFLVSSDCFQGAVSVDTTVTVLYASGFGFCPDGGVISVSGVVPGTVTYSGGGEVVIQEQNETAFYDSCQELEVCR
jgi:hypothetical protein